MKTLIKNGTIITSADTFTGDLLIEDQHIAGIASRISQPAELEIDASGKYVIPGGIDVHTHFQLPVKGTVSADDFLSGSMAGACGGITTFIDFAHMVKGQNPHEALDLRMEEARDSVYIDYSLHLGVSGFGDQLLEEVPSLIGRGVPSFKLYMIYAREGWMSDDGAFYWMLQSVRDNGGMVMVHAENPHLIDSLTERFIKEGKVQIPYHPQSRPGFVEAEAIRRVLYLTEITDSRIYIVHVSTGEGVQLISQAKGRGVMAFGETCPQYLLLTDEIYSRPDGYLYATAPPLRKDTDREALWKGLSMGALQVVSTDHCAFTRQQKEPGRDDFTKLPGGLPGIETLLPLTYHEGVAKGRIGLNQWVDLLSTNPARMFGLYPRKGTLAPGADADVVIFDPEKPVKISPTDLHYKVDYNPFEGINIKGWPQVTISRGRVVYRDGQFTGDPRWGQFIPRFYEGYQIQREHTSPPI